MDLPTSQTTRPEGTAETTRPADPVDPTLRRSRLVRLAYVVAGFFSLALGIAGVVLPVLPTTPFVLLAAACFARGSQRFYRWLLATRAFGPLIRDWRDHRALRRSTKIKAIALIAVTMSISIVLVPSWWLRLLLVLIGLGVAFHLWRLPTREPVALEIDRTAQ